MTNYELPIRGSPDASLMTEFDVEWLADDDYVSHSLDNVDGDDLDIEEIVRDLDSKSSKMGQAPPGAILLNPNGQTLALSPRSSSPWQHVISVSDFDPFSTLPIPVDKVTNELLHFYQLQSYWQTAYALSPNVKPSMKGSWEDLTENSNSHFHILMARSALHQLHMNDYLQPQKQKKLQFAALQHETTAVSNLRSEVSKGSKANRISILVSVISLATFEMRYGSKENALIHFKAARDLVKQLGMGHGNPFRGQPHLQPIMQQALWFEGIYDNPGASFMWDEDDVRERLGWLNELLEHVDQIWRNRQLLPIKTRKSFVLPKTRFHEFLMRDTSGDMISVYRDISEGVAQQRCILIFLCVVAELYRKGTGKAQATTTGSDFKTFTAAVLAYSVWIEDMLVEHDLDEKSAQGDLLWILLHDFSKVRPRSSNDAALDALYRLDFQDIHWRAAGLSNVLKSFTNDSRSKFLGSMLAFIDGKRYGGKVKLS